MSAITSGFVGGAIAAVVVAVAKRKQGPAKIDSTGWRSLRAGWFLNATVIGCLSMAALPAYLLISGGSTRLDAKTQNFYALVLLVVGFGLASAYISWIAYGRIISWKDNELRVGNILGRNSILSVADARSITRSELSGDYRVLFDDGSVVRFSAYLHGAKELAARVSKHTKEH